MNEDTRQILIRTLIDCAKAHPELREPIALLIGNKDLSPDQYETAIGALIERMISMGSAISQCMETIEEQDKCMHIMDSRRCRYRMMFSEPATPYVQ